MKNLKLVEVGFLVVFFIGCHGKHDEKLAQNYYQLSRLEIADERPGIIDYKRALMHIDKAIACSKSPLYPAIKATYLLQIGKHDKAEQLYASLMQGKLAVPYRGEIENNYACTLVQKGELEKAVSIWERLKDDINYATPENALYNLSKCFLMQGKTDQARRAVDESIRHDPNFSAAYYQRAIIDWYYEQDGDAAQQALARLLFLEPTHQRGKRLAAIIERDTKDTF